MTSPTALAPINQVVATAMSVLEGADTGDRTFFKEWIYLGMLEIGPNLVWYKEAALYPTTFTLKKPDGFHSAVDLALFDGSNTEIRYVWRGTGTRIHASDNTLLNAGVYAPTQGAPVDVSEDQYYYHLGSNSGTVNYAILKYWELPFDENGDLLIPETDIMALVLFLRYMWYMRKNDKQGIALAQPLWIRSRNEARAAHRIPSMLEGLEIARTWNSMIRKQRYKTF
jgi:hypothetical protein